jgi:serine protease Do
MRLRGFLFGLAGGIVGTVLIVIVLLGMGVLNLQPEKTVVERVVQTTPSTSLENTSGAGLTPAQIYQMDAMSVVEIVSTFPGEQTFFGTTPAQQGIGSGFVVSSDGYILTNAHVVVDYPSDTSGFGLGGGSAVKASSVNVIFKGSGGHETVTVPGTIVGVDGSNDVALLKVDPSKVPNLKPIALGNSDKIAVGDPVVAIGNPLGYDFSLSAGVVSAVGRTIDSPNSAGSIANAIQTDAAINPGNSGGPLIDSQGAVIGINDQIASTSGGNQGVGFAVPINTAVRSMEQLRTYGGVTWLGISGVSITADLAKALNLSQTQGVLVQEVVSGSPAEKAGLRGGSSQITVQSQTFVVGGDIITAFNGTKISTMQQLVTAISKLKPGDKVAVTVVRGGKTLDLHATLEIRPADM